MLYYKKALLLALKKEGMTSTVINFIHRYERKICSHKTCPSFGKPYLGRQLDINGCRRYSGKDIKQIVKTAKQGWIKKHWHWFPNI